MYKQRTVANNISIPYFNDIPFCMANLSFIFLFNLSQLRIKYGLRLPKIINHFICQQNWMVCNNKSSYVGGLPQKVTAHQAAHPQYES